MTRSYFLDNVIEWYELIELCRNNECDICEDIIDDDQLDEYIDYDIRESGCGWRAIRDCLSNISTGYNYYRCDGAFNYFGLDDTDLDDYKVSVLDWMDDHGLWDDEEGEEGFDEEPGEEPEELPVEEEDFSVGDLISMCGSELVTIQQAAERRKREQAEETVWLLAV